MRDRRAIAKIAAEKQKLRQEIVATARADERLRSKFLIWNTAVAGGASPSDDKEAIAAARAYQRKLKPLLAILDEIWGTACGRRKGRPILELVQHAKDEINRLRAAEIPVPAPDELALMLEKAVEFLVSLRGCVTRVWPQALAPWPSRKSGRRKDALAEAAEHLTKEGASRKAEAERGRRKKRKARDTGRKHTPNVDKHA